MNINRIKNKFIKNNGVINSKDIYVQASKYKYISFDIFDTLLKRNCNSPIDIFKLVEEKLKIKKFVKLRIDAEAEAKKNLKKEVTLKEIYDFIPIGEELKESALNEELRSEYYSLTYSYEIVQLFNKLIQDGKKIMLISDMYLSKAFIEKVLSKNGIIGYEKLYISCEVNKSKVDSTLFSYVLNDLGIKKGELFHIGDSYLADSCGSRKLGIKCYRIPRNIRNSKQYFDNSNSLKMNYLTGFIKNYELSNVNDYFKFGFDAFGPFLSGFAKYLLNDLKKKNITKVYFFSRDGLIMKNAFDIYSENSNIKSYYLEVSRRSLRLPILSLDLSFDNLISTLSVSKTISIKSIFDALGLEIEQYNELLNKFSLKSDSEFDRELIKANTSLLKLFDELVEIVKPICNKEYELLTKYLSQMDLHGKIAVVDIGWSGGMQRYIEQALNKMKIGHNIEGYYFGVTEAFRRNIDIINSLKLNGYIFDCANNPNDKDIRGSFVGIIESICLEGKGSVKNYYLKGNKVFAKRYDYELMENGKYSQDYFNMMDLQKGALAFVECIHNNEVLNEFEFSSTELFSNFKNKCTNPDKVIIKLFSKMKFFDEGETFELANPKKLFYYLFHLKKFKNDFLKSRWKAGFLKQLFKINLKYDKIYDFLKRR